MLFDLPAVEALTDEIASDVKDWFTKKNKIECYVIAGRDGSNVARIQLKASKNDYYAESSFTCRILEINGETISEDEQNKKAVRNQFVGTVPMLDEQMDVVREALTEFGLPADFYLISDQYAVGKIRIIRLRKKVMEKKRRDDNVCN